MTDGQLRGDNCPDCGHLRVELAIAPGRFYCSHCGVAGPGPAPAQSGDQLGLGL